jgi:hypothetical protein
MLSILGTRRAMRRELTGVLIMRRPAIRLLCQGEFTSLQ